MQGGVDVSAPFWISPLRLVVVLLFIIALVAARFFIRRQLKNAALRRQRKEAERAQRKDPRRIDDAIAQLHSVYAAYQRQELSAAVAVEQASAVVRETFDEVMNHRTRYQAHYEIANRRLENLAALIAQAYPVQFVGTDHLVSPEAVKHIFDTAEGVLSSCR
ncbi:hypothetical protein KC957_01175 [Candidatus Saccharibacteria bacterium]|nr:hypothetical protein [Candidatus Saccharibacteria bacterium]